jgi:transcriptional regulator with XRE-family HTH domain
VLFGARFVIEKVLLLAMLQIHKKVASNIAKLLQEKGKSAEKLAFEIGMSKSYLYAFLSGKKDTTLKSLNRIAKGLNVKVEDFFKS